MSDQLTFVIELFSGTDLPGQGRKGVDDPTGDEAVPLLVIHAHEFLVGDVEPLHVYIAVMADRVFRQMKICVTAASGAEVRCEFPHDIVPSFALKLNDVDTIQDMRHYAILCHILGKKMPEYSYSGIF